MTHQDLKRRIWQNSISNYVFLVVRSALGLVLLRLVVNSLTAEEFGFWGLLWSILGYGILLDFGFGFTAQKRVAELSAHEKWDELSKVLSTIFFCYVGLALVLIAFGVCFSPYLIKLFAIENAANLPVFTRTMIIFFCGMGLAFPLGIFPEMLKGQQRIGLANYTILAGFLISFVLMILCIRYKGGLPLLLVSSLGSNMLAEVICGVLALRAMPRVRIQPRYFSSDMVKSTMRFSVFAYITTLTTVILTRTDQLVLGTMVAVSAAGLYAIAAKVPEVVSSFAIQIPDTLSPVAAHSHAKGDKEFLRQLLLEGTRFTVMVATPVYLLCGFCMDQFIWVITGNHVKPEVWWTAEVLLFWGYTMIITQSVTKRIFMMSGHERRLMWLGVGEALLNLFLSIILVRVFHSLVSVAVGSLVATFFFGWFWIWPWAAREANLSGWRLARTVLFPTWLACLPLLVLILIGRRFEFQPSIYSLLAESAIVGCLGAICLWQFALRPIERMKFAQACARVFSRGTPA